MQSYKEQYDRTKRKFELFTEINNGKIHDKPSPYYGDLAQDFFQNCYHLKDWIKNDPSCLHCKNIVESYITNSVELSICADICNATKHLTLTSPRSNKNPQLSGIEYKMKIMEAGSESIVHIAAKFYISTSSGDRDALDLATLCMDAWDSFIKNQKI